MNGNDHGEEPKDELNDYYKVDPNTIKRAEKDLKELLGRDPTAKEMEKFLTDMVGPTFPR